MGKMFKEMEKLENKGKRKETVKKLKKLVRGYDWFLDSLN